MGNKEQLFYIESFDTILYPYKNYHEFLPEIIQRKAQSEIQTMLSLLFGSSIVISEPQSFDSLAFLNIAVEVIKKRNSHTCEDRTIPDIYYHPFKLALRNGHADYQNVIIDLFKQNNFILSAWSDPISSDIKIRNKLAKEIGNEFKIKTKIEDQEWKIIENYRELNNYFSRSDNYIKAHSSGFNQQTFIDVLEKNKNKSDQYSNIILNSIKKMKDIKISINNRSDIRNNKARLLNFIEEKDYNITLEFLDSCYNIIVVDSIGANAKYDNVLNEDTYKTREFTNYLYYYQIEKKSLLIDTYLDINNLSKEDYSYLNKNIIDWDNIWDILLDNYWIESIKKIQSSQNQFDLEKATNIHIEFLAKKLSPKIDIKFNAGKLILNILGVTAAMPTSIASYCISSNVQMDDNTALSIILFALINSAPLFSSIIEEFWHAKQDDKNREIGNNIKGILAKMISK